jgi:hypothetical protein
LENTGWDIQTHVREEVRLTDGPVTVRGPLVARGKSKRADCVLYLKPNIPLAVVEEKDAKHRVGEGMQQALEYADMLGIPFAFTSNRSGFLFHDRTGQAKTVESPLKFDQFPTPEELWRRFRTWKGFTDDIARIATQDYYTGASGKSPRYYQLNAINAVVEAVAKGKDRLFLVMATGTGKTNTAFAHLEYRTRRRCWPTHRTAQTRLAVVTWTMGTSPRSQASPNGNARTYRASFVNCCGSCRYLMSGSSRSPSLPYHIPSHSPMPPQDPCKGLATQVWTNCWPPRGYLSCLHEGGNACINGCRYGIHLVQAQNHMRYF